MDTAQVLQFYGKVSDVLDAVSPNVLFKREIIKFHQTEVVLTE
jgi:hypothetical protein